MSRRYYPGTRERLTRALNEGVMQAASRRPYKNPYSCIRSGWPLRLFLAFYRGSWLARGYDPCPRQLPVVDLSAEFADAVRDVEPLLAAKSERVA